MNLGSGIKRKQNHQAQGVDELPLSYQVLINFLRAHVFPAFLICFEILCGFNPIHPFKSFRVPSLVQCFSMLQVSFLPTKSGVVRVSINTTTLSHLFCDVSLSQGSFSTGFLKSWLTPTPARYDRLNAEGLAVRLYLVWVFPRGTLQKASVEENGWLPRLLTCRNSTVRIHWWFLLILCETDAFHMFFINRLQHVNTCI